MVVLYNAKLLRECVCWVSWVSVLEKRRWWMAYSRLRGAGTGREFEVARLAKAEVKTEVSVAIVEAGLEAEKARG